MQRFLSIVLNENCMINKTLITDDSYKLDEYISKNFNDINDIRKKYKAIIDPFLTEHNDMIKCGEDGNDRYYQGQVAILEFLEDETINRVRIIYKNHLKLIRQYIKEQNFMSQFVANNPHLFPPYIKNKIKFALSKTSYEFMIKEWYNSILEKPDYYEICRKILKLKDETTQKKEEVAKLPETVINQTKENAYDDIITDDPDCSYRDSFDPDWKFHPDLDDIARRIYSEDGEPIDNTIDTYDEEAEGEEEYKYGQSKVKTYK